MRMWTLTGVGGQPYESVVLGTLGGYRRARIYGRLDCAIACRVIACDGYVRHRVFLLNKADARDTGYRPCVVCILQAHAAWKGSAGCG